MRSAASTTGSRTAWFPAETSTRHVQWFWEAVRKPGLEVTDTDIATHTVRQDELALPFADATTFRQWAAYSVLGAATLRGVCVESDATVVLEVEAGGGLDLEVRITVDSADGRVARITPLLPSGGSWTALQAAAMRAAHHALDHPRILDDPVAAVVTGGVGDEVIARVRADPREMNGRWFLAARTRWVEDALADARRSGVEQYVLLGAGLDTFALRHVPGDTPLRVFEVDHPRSQEWKRHRLAQLGIAEPSWVTYAPLDFELDDLHDGLVLAGFDPNCPSLVAWTGVVVYLQRPAIEATLARVATWAPGTLIMFDYHLPAERWSRASQAAQSRIRAVERAASAADEPFVTFLDVPEVDRLLAANGFHRIEHLDDRAVRARYAHGAFGANAFPFLRVVRASVARR
jgi:methyltransferase (TIGR00027 family)